MNLELRSGGTVRTGLPGLWAALDRASLSLSKLADAKMAGLDPAIPKLRRGFGLAVAVESLTATRRTPRDLSREIEAVKSEVLAEFARADALVDQADRHAMFLKSMAGLIRYGTDPLYGDHDGDLTNAARTLRNYKMLGDKTGEAEATASILEQNADGMLPLLARAKDLLRKRRAIAQVALYEKSAELWAACAGDCEHPMALVSDADRAFAKAASAKAGILATAYLRGYRSAYYGENRRVPRLKTGAVTRRADGAYQEYRP